MPALSANSSAPSIREIEAFYSNQSIQQKKLIPKGFEQVGRAQGDLDGDSIEDLALIIKQDSPVDEIEPSTKWVILLQGKAKEIWKLWKIGTQHFIDSEPNQMEKNGFAGMSIKKKVLTIQSDFAVTMGGWSAGGCTQKWRLEKEGFQLIGLTVSEFNRGCACGSTLDINYLTSNSILKTDRSPDGEQLPKEKITHQKIPKSKVFWEAFNYSKLCSIN